MKASAATLFLLGTAVILPACVFPESYPRDERAAVVLAAEVANGSVPPGSPGSGGINSGSLNTALDQLAFASNSQTNIIPARLEDDSVTAPLTDPRRWPIVAFICFTSFMFMMAGIIRVFASENVEKFYDELFEPTNWDRY